MTTITKPFDKEAGARYMRELREEQSQCEREADRVVRRAMAEQKARMRQRRKPTDWPLDARTLERSDRVQADDVRAPAEPELPPMKFYKAEAAKAGPLDPRGLVAVDPNLQIYRRSQFERELLLETEKRSAAWTPDYVDMRLTEAVRVCFRTIGRIGPRAFGSAMPTPLLEMADLVSQAENRSLRRTMGRLLRNFGPPSALEVRRAAEAEAWPLEYLKQCDPKVRLFVQCGALWKASNASVSAKCRDLGVSRQCFYATRKNGLQMIVDGLVQAGRVTS